MLQDIFECSGVPPIVPRACTWQSCFSSEMKGPTARNLRTRSTAAEPVDMLKGRTRLTQHLESALAHIRDYAVVFLDAYGFIAGWNRGAEQLLGYSAAEAIGQPFGMLFTSVDRQARMPAHELEAAARAG